MITGDRLATYVLGADRTGHGSPGWYLKVPERAAEYEAIGLGSGPMGYLASRSAPMGPVNTAVVARSIPRAWMLAGTAEILAAR